MITNEYLKRVYDSVEKRDPDQPEFLQAVREVFESLQLVVDKHLTRAACASIPLSTSPL